MNEIPGSLTPTELERSLVTPILILLILLLIIVVLNLIVKVIINLHVIVKNCKSHIIPQPIRTQSRQHLTTPDFDI